MVNARGKLMMVKKLCIEMFLMDVCWVLIMFCCLLWINLTIYYRCYTEIAFPYDFKAANAAAPQAYMELFNKSGIQYVDKV